MKKLFLAVAALAAITASVPAAAQIISGQITIGTGNRYTYPGTGYYDQRYGQYGYGQTNQYGYGQYGARTNACGRDRTLVRIQGIRTGDGVFYVSENGTQRDSRLFGQRTRPTTSLCLNNQAARYGSVSIVHDVNNNGYFDRFDGIARVNIEREDREDNYGSYGNDYNYGRQSVEVARMQYGYRQW